MITVSSAPPALSSDVLSLYYTKDALLDNLPVLVFYGPSTTGNSTQNSSRIQAHIYSLAGFQSFPRLTIAPTSPLYAAVDHLPLEKRGDEVCRGLAVSVLSYFAGLPKSIKLCLRDSAAVQRLNGLAPAMFDEMHAGDLAASMMHVEQGTETANHILSSLSAQVVSWVDMDVVLPSGTIQRATLSEGQDQVPSFDDNGLPLFHYGQYTAMVDSLGSPAFLPTSKIKRAPSRPTAHSKSRILSKDQKISLRREMCELVDTENNYIGKIHDLVHSVAVAFGQTNRPDLVDAMFPESLRRVLEVNESFYNEIQTILDSTENEAIKDIEGNIASEDHPGSPVLHARRRDPSGTTEFAKALLKWFPKFMNPYHEYLRSSANFSTIVGQCIADESSSISHIVQNYGEQRLRSALIEPVQRLPRYSLLIDNMVNSLPASHPALSCFLKARDVITDICALDAPASADIARFARILKNLVTEWPASLSPPGRLITAVDVLELPPPYETKREGIAEVLLLFPDTLVLLQKISSDSLSARGIIAELDGPIMPTNAASSSTFGFDKGLHFLGAYNIFDLRFTESENGNTVRLAPFTGLASRAIPVYNSEDSNISTRVFSLLGPYEGKAARFTGEVAKARTESRFSEVLRDCGKWALRSISPSEEGLGTLLALSENQLVNIGTTTHNSARILLFVDGPKDVKSILKQDSGIDIAASISTSESSDYHLEIQGADGSRFTDNFTIEDLTSILLKRLGSLFRLQHQPHNPAMTESHISYHRTILRTIPFQMQQEETRPRAFRPISPVKIISNFLSGGTTSQTSTPLKRHAHVSVIENVPAMLPPAPPNVRADFSNRLEEQPLSSKMTVVESANGTLRSPLALLEDTFAAYIVALRSRSGNVVGKVLRSRAAADELVINELYNTLLEDSSRLQAAAEVSVDVLFAAFEKFLKRAWRERMGPLLATSVLQAMQSSFDSGKPALFSQQFKKLLEDMSPQNKRAFAAAVKLLSDLLDASGNDGDRGALIASFAEALVLDGNPHDYITLLDRMVDDYDSLFQDEAANLNESNTGSATGSLTRTRSFNTGSLSSNASSLRKKFGFSTLSRENSKHDSESKVASIWRTLSKNTKSPGDSNSGPPSLSKASLARSRSTDVDTRMLPPLRPVSRDWPTTSGFASQDEPRSRPGSAHLNTSTLSSIGEGTPTKPTVPPKKKQRRSSLSDLRPVHDPDIVASAWSPLQPRKWGNVEGREAPIRSSPKTSSPVKQSLGHRQSPQPSGLPRRFGSPQRKENSPARENSPRKSNSPSMPRNPSTQVAVKQRHEEVVIKSFSSQKRTTSRSGIPAPKGGLSERAWPPNGNNTPSKQTTQSPQKLRMQSPQKLRERLSQEQKALTTAESSLQAEIAKIGEEMAVYKVQRSPSKPRTKFSSTNIEATPSTPSTPTLQSISTTLDSLSTKLKTFTASQTTSLSSITSDLESSLLVSDNKARKLDELYKEANAENEALYERFNDELGKILGKVRKGEGLEEMRGKLGEAQDEVVKLRKENMRLKREVVGLRSLLKGD